MKAIRLTDQDSRVHLDTVAEPAITNPWDVIVRIGGAGLCRTDLHMLDGAVPGLSLPLTLGHENAGWVTAVGSEVGNVQVGDAVILHPLSTCGLCLPCRRGDDMGCIDHTFTGFHVDGGMAELLNTSARAVVKLPQGLEPANVAAHADAGLTAYHAVKKALPRLSPDSSAVVVGAGGVGHIAMQCLKAMSPTRVIVVDRREVSLELARELGADDVVLADGSEVDRVLELTDGAGANAVLDCVGEGGAETAAKAMVGSNGAHYIIGYGATIEVSTLDMVATAQSVIGCRVGSYIDLVELMSLVSRGHVTLRTDLYPLEAFGDALSDMRAGRMQGRAVLVP